MSPKKKPHGGKPPQTDDLEGFEEIDLEEDEGTELTLGDAAVEWHVDGTWEPRGAVALLPWGPEVEELHERNYYGTPGDRPNGKFLELTPFEALVLHERGRVILHSPDGSPYDVEGFAAEMTHRDPRFWIKYVVYRELRRRGYVVREGLGSGIEFRVYDRGARRGSDAAKLLVYILPEGERVQIQTLALIANQSMAARKELVLAIVDRLGDTSFYKLKQVVLPTLQGAATLDW
jgi:tRNA-intron endonuclease